jgi:hypothetical protein
MPIRKKKSSTEKQSPEKKVIASLLRSKYDISTNSIFFKGSHKDLEKISRRRVAFPLRFRR